MIALVTCHAALDLDTDLPLLVRELPEAAVVSWDDDTVDWEAFRVVIIRSAWDYHQRSDEFLAWARHVARVSTLWNPLDVIEWNIDKRYLADVERRGVPIVPTSFIESEQDVSGVVTAGDIVVKPSVGAGSNGVFRSRGDRQAALAHTRSLLAAGSTVMVQPYVERVDVTGETGLVYLGGEFSHAFRKSAILAEPVEFEGGLMAVEQSSRHLATVEERALGAQVASLLPPTAYARIDLLPGEGGPVVLELELTEPSLFLHHDPGAAARAAAVFRSLAT